jgi:hypothetical protein
MQQSTPIFSGVEKVVWENIREKQMDPLDIDRDIGPNQWRQIREFPDYSVSSGGLVRNDRTGRLMARTLNQQGIVQVGFCRNGRYFKRSVAVLVAKAFIPHRFGAFDTPINVDGDRTNNSVQNLMWRPRWFAIMYHKQFDRPYHGRIRREIVDVKTDRVYPDSFICAIENGLLEKDVVLSIANRTVVWPTYQQFQVIE